MGIFFFIDFAKNSQLVAFSKNQGISSIFCPVFFDFTIIQCYADTVDIFGWQISEICPLYWHNLRFSRNFVKKCIFLLSFQLKSLPLAREKRLTWNLGELLITDFSVTLARFGNSSGYNNALPGEISAPAGAKRWKQSALPGGNSAPAGANRPPYSRKVMPVTLARGG